MGEKSVLRAFLGVFTVERTEIIEYTPPRDGGAHALFCLISIFTSNFENNFYHIFNPLRFILFFSEKFLFFYFFCKI